MPSSPDRKIRPLSRRASRWLVLGLLVLALTIAILSSLYLVESAEEASQRREQLESPSSPGEALPDSTEETP